MQALRQIVNVHNNFFQVALPPEFKTNRVEIIVFPVEEKVERKLKNSERFCRAISKGTAEKLHNHINEVRNEWERNIY